VVQGQIVFACGGLTIGSGSKLAAPNGNLTVNGNWNDAGTFINNSGTVVFGGTGTCISPNTLTASGTEAFSSLSVINGAYVTLNSPVTVAATGILTLTAGVFKTSATNTLTVNNTSTAAVVVSNQINSFISGPLTWSLAAAGGTYGFPVGTGCIPAVGGLPLQLVKSNGSAAIVTITPFNIGSGGTVDATLSSLSSTEYWALTSTANLTGSTVSVGRALPVPPGTLIARSNTTSNGVYSSIGGTAFSNGVGNSTDIGAGTSLFFTLGTPPIVSTLAATSITTTGATLNGAFNTNNIQLPTSFNYGLTTNYGTAIPTLHSPLTTSSSITDSVAITGLTANTLYNYVATDGANMGSNVTFTTLSNPPVIAAGTNPSGSGFTANWSAPAAQGNAAYTYTVQVSTDPNFGTIAATKANISSGSISTIFSGLVSATPYYYRVQAVNAGGGSAWSATASISTDIVQTAGCSTGIGSTTSTGSIVKAPTMPVIDGQVDPVWNGIPANNISFLSTGNNTNNTQTWKAMVDR
jgi:hypothetical protein